MGTLLEVRIEFWSGYKGGGPAQRGLGADTSCRPAGRRSCWLTTAQRGSVSALADAAFCIWGPRKLQAPAGADALLVYYLWPPQEGGGHLGRHRLLQLPALGGGVVAGRLLHHCAEGCRVGERGVVVLCIETDGSRCFAFRLMAAVMLQWVTARWLTISSATPREAAPTRPCHLACPTLPPCWLTRVGLGQQRGGAVVLPDPAVVHDCGWGTGKAGRAGLKKATGGHGLTQADSGAVEPPWPCRLAGLHTAGHAQRGQSAVMRAGRRPQGYKPVAACNSIPGTGRRTH